MLMPMLVVLSTLTAQQKPDMDVQAVERMKFYRKSAGLAPVTLEPATGKGLPLQAQHLATNWKDPSTEGLGMHNEDPKLPGYTAEGAKAGKASVIFPTGDPVGAVDRWMASLFHRVPLLDPTL